MEEYDGSADEWECRQEAGFHALSGWCNPGRRREKKRQKRISQEEDKLPPALRLTKQTD